MPRSCPTLRRRLHPLLLAPLLLLGGCQLLGGDDVEAAAARKEAEGKAIGGACRHAGRAIEDCFALNKRADKAALFAGWREMNDYMRENKIDAVLPQGPALANSAPERAAEGGEKSDKAGKTEPAPGEEGVARKPARNRKLDG